ncbi:putative MFS family arabinose efflux permease [Paraburkholderia unamae]|uniref:MFS transporter n=1 Tax=Paraburkholderia unamae TaxID=219649 RepID=UPI000DC39EAA|nr:MFS transporter [Paraburkholderia unamae]RAR53649.1 putative MFS family arabinose efflux permease [Paraburkholderia unamae]
MSFTRSSAFRIAVIYSLGVLAAMTVGGAIPVLDAIAAEFHPRDPSLIGLVMSLPSVMVALGALVAGYFVDRFGDKQVLVAGSVAMIVGDAIVVAAPTMQALLIGRGVCGLGYVLMAVSAITLLIRVVDEKRRNMAIAVWSTFVPVSMIIPFLTAGLVFATGNWRTAFIGHAAITVLATLVLIASIPARDKSSRQLSRTAGIGAVLRSPWPYLLGISIGGDAFLHVGIIATLAPYLHAHYGTDPMTVNMWNVGAMAMNALGCLLFGKLLDWGAPPVRTGLLAILVTGVPAVAIYALPLGVPASIALSWLLLFASGVLTGMWAYTPSVAPSPESIGATSGLVTQITLLGVLLSGPVCFAAQAAPTPLPMVITIVAGVLACSVRLPILARGTRPRWAAGQGDANVVAAHG